MEINLSVIILVIVVFLLLIYIAYLKGQKSSQARKNETKETYSTLKVEKVASEINQQVKRDPKNEKYLQEIKSILSKFIEKYTSTYSLNVFYPFLKSYSELVDYLEQARNEEELSIDTIENAIRWVSINSLKAEIEKEINNSSNSLVEGFNDLINYEIESYPIARLKHFYKSDDQLEMAQQKIQNIFRRNIAPFYSELAEIQSSQSRCISLWRDAKDILEESGIDFGSLAKSFGSGVLIAINPFIGVPALIAHYFNEDSKAKRKEKIINEFFESYHQYLESWDKSRAAIEPISEEISNAIKKSMMSNTYNTVIKILEEIDKAGYSLKDQLIEFRELLKEE